ncbi:tetratricopeptide repeat protein [bacterium]|nr:tetratricopeptide repeat protein [bacterium]
MKNLLWIMVLLLAGCAVNTAERNNAGNAALARGAYDTALRAYRAAQVESPDRPEPYYNAAAALLGLAEFEQAIAALEQALSIADSFLAVRAYYNLGNIFFEQREFGAAIAAYREALLIDPDYGPARYNLELALLRFVPATPTALEQQTNPDMGQTDPETTPTDQPGGV